MKFILVSFSALLLAGCINTQCVEPVSPIPNEQVVITPDAPTEPLDTITPDDTINIDNNSPERGEIVERQLFTSGFAMCQVQPDLTICRNECERVNNQRYFCTEGYEFIFERDGDMPR